MNAANDQPIENGRTPVLLWVLTLIYLCFELAFNARLLDAVGSRSTIEQIHRLEQFGRCLSGIAVALVALQIMLSRRSRSTSTSPSNGMIFLKCTVAGVLTFFSLQLLVDGLVKLSSPNLRRLSSNILVVKQQILSGNALLDGLADDQRIFEQPEGKVFLALFPAMALSVNGIEDKIRASKPKLVKAEIERQIGGPKNLHELYLKASEVVALDWKNYRNKIGQDAVNAEIARQQDLAWTDYNNRLQSRGWTPQSIPRYARALVAKDVRQRVPVPANWNPSDASTFRQAVAKQVRQKFIPPVDITIGGQRIPAGLDYATFFSYAAIQSQLKGNLGLPSHVHLKANYTSAQEFIDALYTPMVRDRMARQMLILDSPERTFANDQANAKSGMDAMRGVLIPPIALFLSLLGAIGHLSKLCYLTLMTTLDFTPRIAFLRRFAWIFPLFVLISLWLALSLSDNLITKSRVFIYLREQIMQEGQGAAMSKVISSAMHLVATGQAYSYPINEFIRINLLQSVDFGWQPLSINSKFQ